MLLQGLYFINLLFGAGTINIKWSVRRKFKLLKFDCSFLGDKYGRA